MTGLIIDLTLMKATRRLVVAADIMPNELRRRSSEIRDSNQITFKLFEKLSKDGVNFPNISISI